MKDPIFYVNNLIKQQNIPHHFPVTTETTHTYYTANITTVKMVA